MGGGEAHTHSGPPPGSAQTPCGATSSLHKTTRRPQPLPSTYEIVPRATLRWISVVNSVPRPSPTSCGARRQLSSQPVARDHVHTEPSCAPEMSFRPGASVLSEVIGAPPWASRTQRTSRPVATSQTLSTPAASPTATKPYACAYTSRVRGVPDEDGHQRSSEVIRGHQRSSEVIRGHQRSSEVMSTRAV